VPVRVLRLAMVPSLIVAVTTPVVLASMVFAWETVALPVTVAATAVAVSIVVALIAKAISAAVPVRVVTAFALTVAEVLESIVFRSAAEADPELIVTPTAEAVSMVAALIAVAISAAVPVRVATEAAFTLTVVLLSRVFKAAAFTEESVTAMV